MAKAYENVKLRASRSFKQYLLMARSRSKRTRPFTSGVEVTPDTPVRWSVGRPLTLTLSELLLDHLVNNREQPRGNSEAERLCGLEVDDEFVLSRLHDRQVGGSRARKGRISAIGP
jgi:hypothetical protein